MGVLLYCDWERQKSSYTVVSRCCWTHLYLLWTWRQRKVCLLLRGKVSFTASVGLESHHTSKQGEQPEAHLVSRISVCRSQWPTISISVGTASKAQYIIFVPEYDLFFQICTSFLIRPSWTKRVVRLWFGSSLLRYMHTKSSYLLIILTFSRAAYAVGIRWHVNIIVQSLQNIVDKR